MTSMRLTIHTVCGLLVLAAPAALEAATLHSGDLIAVGVDNGSPAVVAIDPVTGERSTVSSGGSLLGTILRDVAVDSSGNIFVTDDAGRIFGVDSTSGAQSVITAGGIGTPWGLDVDNLGNIFVADTQGNLFRTNATTGATTLVVSGLGVASGVAIEASGAVLISDSTGDAVLRWDPGAGELSTLSSGGSFQFPRGLAIEADGSVLMADQDARQVFRIDPATGAQTVVSSDGALFPFRTFGVDVESSGGIVVANTVGGIIRVDPATGAQDVVHPLGGGFYGTTGVAVYTMPGPGTLVLAALGALSILGRGSRR